MSRRQQNRVKDRWQGIPRAVTTLKVALLPRLRAGARSGVLTVPKDRALQTKQRHRVVALAAHLKSLALAEG